MGEKQGLEAILVAAESNRQHDHLKFVLCGSGPYKEKLMSICQERKLVNVYFLPLQPLETFNEFLNMADIHLIIQKAGASDLVMPSKLGPILAVGGVALVTANEGTSLHSLIKIHNMGFVIDAEDQKALENGILRLLAEDNPDLGMNARKYAVDFLSIDHVMARFERAIKQLWPENRLLRGASKNYKHVSPPVSTPHSL
jgi:colanic acid biosynthesis glycosyl transferase WcaI